MRSYTTNKIYFYKNTDLTGSKFANEVAESSGSKRKLQNEYLELQPILPF